MLPDMSEVLFYHLERATLEHVLPGLLEKTLERGWKAVVQGGSREKLEALDNHLWTYRDEAFLPHGLMVVNDEDKNSRQPVLLSDQETRSNEPQILFLVDGAQTDASSIDTLARCVMIFDGRDETAVGDARGFWKSAKAAGHDVTYWKQSSAGRWEKQGN
ncbi:MAG: DNA polymerase III subunit chi [Hyphococcus sp.]|nr:MAG: DNA polymerase III subunit chi [Marinicaulis sp.]